VFQDTEFPAPYPFDYHLDSTAIKTGGDGSGTGQLTH